MKQSKDPCKKMKIYWKIQKIKKNKNFNCMNQKSNNNLNKNKVDNRPSNNKNLHNKSNNKNNKRVPWISKT